MARKKDGSGLKRSIETKAGVLFLNGLFFSFVILFLSGVLLIYVMSIFRLLFLYYGVNQSFSLSSFSEYGFAEKVVEGISLSVNSIIIRMKAKAFNASFELSQLRIYSVNANWQHGDLRFTRIQDPQRGEVGER